MKKKVFNLTYCKLEQIKLHSQQLVAEALTLMRKESINTLPVYEDERFIGRITYNDLIFFVNRQDTLGKIHAHKMHFDLGSVIVALRAMKNDSSDVPPSQDNFVKKLSIGLSAVASIALVLLALTWIFFESVTPMSDNPGTPVVAGSSKVILSLPDGKHVELNPGKKGIVLTDLGLRYKDGSKIENGDYTAQNKSVLSLTVPNGGQYEVLLPDGTKVWLNSASIFKFPSTFKGEKSRRVILDGEAYFEVAKVNLNEKKLPFMVENKNQQIEVLGTHFNVSAYTSEKTITTTLLEGSVRVTQLLESNALGSALDPAASGSIVSMSETGRFIGKSVVIKPNQQAVLTTTGINVDRIDAEEAIAWKNGEFIFRNTSLESIMHMVSRWYDVDVTYDDKETATVLLGGAISKTASINEVLKMLELTANVHFKVNGRKVTVTQ